MRIESKPRTLDLIYSQQRPGCRNSTLSRDYRTCAGCTRRRAGLKEQKLAAVAACRSCAWAPPPSRSTAARSPWWWTRAPARGPATAPPHHGVFPLCCLRFQADLVEDLRGKERGKQGAKERKRGAATVGHRAAQSPTAAGEGAGRGEEDPPPPLFHRAAQEEEKWSG
jgi:hypothetical protein